MYTKSEAKTKKFLFSGTAQTM